MIKKSSVYIYYFLQKLYGRGFEERDYIGVNLPKNHTPAAIVRNNITL